MLPSAQIRQFRHWGPWKLLSALTLVSQASLLAQTIDQSALLLEQPRSVQLGLPDAETEITLPPLGPSDLESLQIPDEAPRPVGVTRSFPTDELSASFDSNDGAWQSTSAGPVWRMRVVSPAAQALRLHFRDLALGGGKLWIHDGKEQMFGPFEEAGPFEDGDFWGPIVWGDTLEVEYLPAVEPSLDNTVPFRIVEIGHFWGAPVEPVPPKTGRNQKNDERLPPSPRAMGGTKHWTRSDGPTARQQPRRIAPGLPVGFRLELDGNDTIFTGASSYRFDVPEGTESVEFDLRSVRSDIDLGLFVRFKQDNGVVDGRVLSDHQSDGIRGDKTLVISRSSIPPLRSGTYFISVGAGTSTGIAEGTLVVTPRYVPESCFTDMSCHTDAWGSLASAIAMITFAADDGNHYVCSGALLNDRSGSDSPYFLTAAHCIGTETEARSIVAHWYFQNANCSGRHEAENRDSRYRTTSGATLLAFEDGSLPPSGGINRYGDGDMALLRLREQAPPGVAFLGWDAGRMPFGTNVLGIHHAEGLHKQVAFGQVGDNYGHMSGVSWGNGLVLGGASGSPLLDTEGRVLGVLSGGRHDFEGCFSSGSPAIYSNFQSFFPKIRTLLEAGVLPPPQITAGGRLEPGRPQFYRLTTESAGRIQNGEHSYIVDVPLDATKLTLSLEPDDPNVNVDLYVRHGADLGSLSDSDWSSTTQSGDEEIAIGRTTSPPLLPGRYYVSLRLDENAGSVATGTLTAIVERGNALPLGMEFVTVPAGEFMMGSESRQAGFYEKPTTRVRITAEYQLGRHEVTQGQWQTVMGDNPSWHSSCGTRCPVEDVSWEEVQEFIKRLNLIGDGFDYRLPTEAEWERAARAGNPDERYGTLNEIAWHAGNSGRSPRPVGLKSPNEFGLFDMLGNVSEWVMDWRGDYPGGTITDPVGPRTGWARVQRGCSYSDSAADCRSPAREVGFPSWGSSRVGLRLVRTPELGPATPLGGTLTAERPHRFELGAEVAGVLQNAEHSYELELPAGAKWLRLLIESDYPGANVDLYARYGEDSDIASNADWSGAGSSGKAEIIIGPYSDPPLRSGRHFVTLLRTDELGSRARGTLTASIGYGGSPPGMRFEEIPAGEFVMGSESSDAGYDETPLTQVRITADFEIGRHEVTQGQWEAVMGSNPSSNGECGSACPVERVSWEDAQEFVGRLNAIDDEYNYRLPTEAEWEYSARGGTTEDRYGPADEIAWHSGNSGWSTHPVGLKAPNAFGLYDILGNVSEWVMDWRGGYPGGTLTDPVGPLAGFARIQRGCSYSDRAADCRAPDRDSRIPSSASSRVGLRLLRTPESSPAPAPGGPLAAGSPARFQVGAAQQGTLQNGEGSYVLEVPPGTRWLSLLLVSENPGTSMDVYVRHNADIEGIADAHWIATSNLGRAVVLVGPYSNPPLQAGTHYISVLRTDTLGSRAKGILTAAFGYDASPPGMEFVQIPGGEFLMGSESSEARRDEAPLTRVRITIPFELGRHEVTQGQWRAVMGSNPSWNNECGSDCPVEEVSWDDVQEFVGRLNRIGDVYEYRLPTEAEWEYGARAGESENRYGALDDIAWHSGNSGSSTHPVGLKAANRFGLYDMLGNVSEWVQDWKGDYPGGEVVDPTGPESGHSRVLRGGSFARGAIECRNSAREAGYSTWGTRRSGFRLARRSK